MCAMHFPYFCSLKILVVHLELLMEFVTMFHNLQLSDSYVFHNVNYDFVVIIVYNFKHWGENI